MKTDFNSSFIIASTVVIIFFILGVGLSSSSLSVYGHANPVTYNPKPNQVFDSTTLVPTQVTITFTEKPEIKASSIKVTDSKNTRVDNNDPKIGASDKEVSVSLDKSKILPGVYTVNWLALSKDDGHITKGAYVFTIKPAENKNIASSTGQQLNQSKQNQQQTKNVSVSNYSKNFTENNVNLKLDIAPFKVGQNTFSLSVVYNNGTAVKNIKDIFLQFNNPDKNIGPIVDTMKKVSDGNYTLTGSYLSQNGDWQIKIVVQRIGEYDINQQTPISIK